MIAKYEVGDVVRKISNVYISVIVRIESGCYTLGNVNWPNYKRYVDLSCSTVDSKLYELIGHMDEQELNDYR